MSFDSFANGKQAGLIGDLRLKKCSTSRLMYAQWYVLCSRSPCSDGIVHYCDATHDSVRRWRATPTKASCSRESVRLVRHALVPCASQCSGK